MTKQIRLTRIINQADPRYGIDVRVTYRKDGYKHNKRGYAYTFIPTKQERGISAYEPYKEEAFFIEEANRFSQSKLQALAEAFNIEEYKSIIKAIADAESYTIEL